MGKIKKNNPRAFVAHLIILVAFAMILGTISQAALPKYRPLREILSYNDWEALIKYDAARVPGISKLWTDNENAEMSQVFWGGGKARGFLHWHFIKLQTHTIEEVKQMPLPTADGFQSPGGKDIDIFAPVVVQKIVRKILQGTKDLDILDTANIPEYIKLGGATLEKIGINPYAILDLSGGFKDYYLGRILYKLRSEEEFKSSRFSDADYTKTGEDIRFIRLAYFNFPELENPPENRRLIRENPDRELSKMREGQLAWIEISLRKLLTSSGNNLPEVFSLLLDHNLFTTLLKLGISIPPKLAESAGEWFRTNANLLTPEEQQLLAKKYGIKTDRHLLECEEGFSDVVLDGSGD